MRNYLLLIFSIIELVSLAQMQIDFTPANDGQTFNTCSGFIIDSGGQGGSGYSNNEDVTITICPDNPGDVITISFNTFNLDLFDDDPLAGGNHYNVDEMYVYDGNSTAGNFLGNYNGAGLQGTVIKASSQNPTGCITLRFVSNTSNNAGTWLFTASATCTTPCADPMAGGVLLNGITQDSIHVCIGEFINFQEVGSFAQTGFNLVSYEWDFADGTTANGQFTSHSYTDPGYYRVQLFVTDDNGCTNNNLIDLDVKVATEPDFESFVKDTTICVGEMLSLKANPLLYENTWTSINGLLEIDDGCMYDTLLGVAQELDLVQTGFISGAVIASITDIESICLEIEHTFIGDLVVEIFCPNGQSTILHQQGGGGTFLGEPVESDGINCDDPSTYGAPYQYCFTPTATETWVDYVNNNFPSTLPAGDYAPVEPLDQLVGCPANGIWTLSVVDNWGADDGKVFSFGLNLNPALIGDIVTFTPQHSTASDSSYWHYPSTYGTFLSADADSMVIVPTALGTYVYPYTVVNDFGCSNDTSVTVTVFQVQLPFTLEDIQVCSGTPFLVGGDFVPCQYTLRLDDSFGDGWNGNNLAVQVNGVSMGSYTVLDTDNNGLFIEVPLTLAQNDVVVFTFDGMGSFLSECSYQLIDCSGNVAFSDGGNFTSPQTIPLTYNVNMQGGEAGYSFSWSPAGIMDDPTLAVPTATIGSTTTITMNYFPDDHPACIVSDQMVASIIPDANAGQDNSIDTCFQLTTYDLTSLLGTTFTPNGVWTDPNGNTVTMPLDLTNFITGPYVYSVGNGTCSDFATIMADIRSEPIMQTHFVTDPDVCIGETSIFLNPVILPNLQTMTVSLGDTSAIQNITLNYDSIVYTYPYVGTFDVIVDMLSDNGCVYQDVYDDIVSVHHYPEANFSYQPEDINALSPIVTVTNESSPNMSTYEWFFPGADLETSNNTFETVTYPFSAGLFPITLKIENEYGCRDSITKMIVIDDVSLIYFPTSFTPNDDEHNQTWKIYASSVALDQFYLKIYNRWGEVVFETRDPEVGWDGTYDGVPVQTGIYVWKLQAMDAITNTAIEEEGHINLIR